MLSWVGRFIAGLFIAASVFLFGLCFFLGVVAIVDSFHKPNLPAVHVIFPTEQAKLLQLVRDRQAKDSSLSRFANFPDLYWNRVQPALIWLDAVSPPIADWVRGRWASRRIVFEKGDTGYLAAWQPVTGILFVNVKTLDYPPDFLSEVLAHEFRHSRQPILPIYQKVIAGMFGTDRNDLVENEAEEFGERVRRAIRGQP